MSEPSGSRRQLTEEVLARCQAAIEPWRGLTVDDFDFADPKGFSSFTMGVRARVPVEPDAVLYRHLEGKENAILDSAAEKRVFLTLGENDIAAHCLHYDDVCRIEAFHHGRTLTADDVFDPVIQAGVAGELARFHRLDPGELPEATYFELLFERWGPLVERVLIDQRSEFPDHERHLCEPLLELLASETLTKVLACLPDPGDSEPMFCHNDTYHGNVMALDDGRIKLLDFEFSCLNQPVFDFANFFAETVMVHGLAAEPHFTIAPPRFTDADLASFVQAYLVAAETDPDPARVATLVDQTRTAIMASDYMYAMAAIPLSVEPIQKIRFLPYAARRFEKFLDTWHGHFSS